MATDKTLFLLSVFAIFIGIVFSLSLPVYTVLHFNYGEFHFFIRQFSVGMVSIFLMWIISRMNPEKSMKYLGFGIFFLSLFLMSIMHYLPETFVTSAGGAKRWIRFPGFSFAPVEFFKVGFVYFLAWSFERKLDEGKKSLKEELKLFTPYIAVFILVIYLIAILQNDLGQVIVLGLTLVVMAFFAGTSFKFFSLSILSATVVFLVAILTSEHRVLRIKLWWANIQNMVLSIFPQKLADALRVHDAPEPYQIYHSLNAIKNGGLFGVGLGDLLFLSAVNMLGAGLNSIVGSVYTPLLVFGAFLFLGEPISLSVIVGGIMVVTAIVIIAGESIKTRPKHLYLGIVTGVTGMIFTVAGILLMKDLLSKYSLFWINLLRILTGMIFYLFYFMFRKDKSNIINSFKSIKNWFIIGMAGLLGSYLAIFFWTACLSRLPASVVAVVNQLAIVVIIIFAAIFLKEHITKRKAFAAILAITGAFFAATNLF